MKTGKVKWYNAKKGFGFIESPGIDDVFIHYSGLVNKTEILEEGNKVTFEVENGRKGLQATKVRKLENSNQFYNPYNFVRWSNEAKEETALEHREFDSHLKSSGKTGKLKCTLITKSPLIINESKENINNNVHQIYEFYKKDGRYSIPGSSLRGMLRSVYEALTNSTYLVLNEYDNNVPLFYRGDMDMALNLIPARVVKENDSFKVELLKGHIDNEDSILKAAWVLKHTHKWSPTEGSDYGNRKIPELKDISHRDKVFAILSEPIKHRIKPFKFRNVEEISKDRNSLSKPRNAVEGYYYESGYNFTKKHDERFFYHVSSEGLEPELITLSDKHISRYNQLLDNYKEVNKDSKTPGRVEKGRHIVKDKKLKENDLLYVQLDSENNICGMYPVMISRKQYKTSILDLLPEYLKSPSNLNKVCPASRMFGWVNPRINSEESDSSLKSKIIISDATINMSNFKGTYETTLNILGSPKPTAIPLYLKTNKQEGMSKETQNLKTGYDQQNATLRGRKMYLSHCEVEKVNHKVERSKLNRTIKDAVKAENEFHFDICFSDLSDIELGSLLWLIELEGDMLHRLGYGKPFGYGQVKIKLDAIELDSLERFVTWSSNTQNIISEKEQYINRFKEAMEESFSAKFEEIIQIKDLKEILSPKINRKPIHYPKLSPNATGDHFKWFAKNKAGKRGYYQSLPYATEDKGLKY